VGLTAGAESNGCMQNFEKPKAIELTTMPGLETAVAAMNVVEMTLKVLKIGVTIISDARNYGKDARTLGLTFQQLTYRYDSLQKILFQVDKSTFLHGRNPFS
jgi:DNA integrity scanning protein DisA with diadenylate cyclase activity